MKKCKLLLIVGILLSTEVRSQNTRFIDSVFTTIDKTTVGYSSVFTDNYHKMDVYIPKGDVLSKRPLIFYIHGGAFYAGDKSSQDCVDFCTQFAKKGYVAVSVNYRLANAFLFLSDKKVQLSTVLRSIADIKAALRFFVKDATSTNQYRIDTTAFFIGGYSAGAVAALHTAWVTTESELDQNLKDILKNSIKTLYGDAGNNGYSNPIKAIFSMAGALYQTNYISPGDVPVWMGHAKDDATVSYNCAPGLNNPLVVNLCGTGKLIPELDTAKVLYDTMVMQTGGHDWPGLGNKGVYFKQAVAEIANFFYPMIGKPNASNGSFVETQIPKVYPNPANHSLFIENKNMSSSSEYTLFNIIGQPALKGILTETREALDISKLPRGLYFLSFSNSNYRSIQIVLD
ncbi:MAG: hypothetical protein CK532_08325 [Flavobacteriales bacterium]|nr:T9SS type A sorting domain-containing protein [Flavobacteriaceae bacterium]PHX91435.1 MAG: hypothetical protein CK532_08325 [Flavobacteriales bacterium]